MAQSDTEPSNTEQNEAGENRHAPSGGGFSFKTWWAEQEAASRQDWDRLRGWWRRQTAPVEQPPDGKTQAASGAVKPRGLGNTARIALWAPTAVFLAFGGAAITTAIAFAALASFQDYTVTANRLIVGVTMVATFGLVLLWFANAPNVPTTTKRFWLLLQIEVVVLGMIALIGVIALTLDEVGLLSAQG